MKIIYDYQIFLNQKAGGPSRYFCNLIEEISKKVHVKVSAPIHINDYLQIINKKYVYGQKLDNIIFNSLPDRLKEFIKYKILKNYNLYFQKKKLADFKPDIIHRTYYDDYKTNTPVVLTVYDLIHEKFHEMYGNKALYRPKKKALERADQIICISKNTLEDLNYYYNINNKKIDVIYLGTNAFNSFNTQFQKKENLKEKYLLFVGKRTGYKNFSSLLKAYSLSKKLQSDFKIKCFGGGKQTKHESNFFSNLKIPYDKVDFLQGNDAKLAELYRNATALVYPSKYEGFGLPILEAMSLNCPVLCSNGSSLPEVGGDAVLYFNPNDTESILNSILSAVYSDSVLNNLIMKGREQVKKFKLEDCASSTLKLYKGLI